MLPNNPIPASSSSFDMDEPAPSKILKLELDNPIKVKLSQYLDQFTAAVRSGEFVVQTNLGDAPVIGLRVIEVRNSTTIIINLFIFMLLDKYFEMREFYVFIYRLGN